MALRQPEQCRSPRATGRASPSDGAVVAFSNTPGNPTKLRAELEPCVLDLKVNITDIVHILDAFSGMPFPFGPGIVNCPLDPCDTVAVD